MPAAQISFVAFALARRVIECAPPASTDPVPVLVAQEAGSGGECTPLRARRSAFLCKLRYFAPKRYRVLSFSPWGATLYEFSSRAVAWNLAQRYCGRFVDLGVAA